ncbi:MAG: tRNA epoxyqueuosine(34) reductase QueG [Candidatus Abawacabacteria bacterium]|nr:tRNA epoxyqueuosine(34) reductase QueG [Candidatus Abawacabacteria bacterium]
MTPLSLIYQLAKDQGFQLVKVATAQKLAAEKIAYLQWLEKNHHGEMHYLSRDPAKRTDPDKILPGAKSIILVALNYYQDSPDMIKVARYAKAKPDYHTVFEKKLQELQKKLTEHFSSIEAKFYVDYGPLMERPYAAQASMGFIGKNTLLITKEFGSWVVLGEIITTLDLVPEPAEKHGSCGSCRRCLDICPTGALKDNYDLDSNLCISYLTIEYKGSIPVNLRKKIGTWLFGCDLCQEVCPHNSRAKAYSPAQWQDISIQPDLTNTAYLGSLDFLKRILSIATDEEFKSFFANTPFLRAKRTGLIRNACIVAGNLKDASLLPYLKALINDSSLLIKEHAQWAVEELVSVEN